MGFPESFLGITLPETDSKFAPGNGWKTIVSFWGSAVIFAGVFAVSFREGIFLDTAYNFGWFFGAQISPSWSLGEFWYLRGCAGPGS